MAELTARQREQQGGRTAKQVRRQGALPGVVYGPEIDHTTPVTVDARTFSTVFREAGETSLIDLQVGETTYPVLVYEMQLDPISNKPIHVDFYAPSMSETVEATVPIVLEGEAPAVKEYDGTLMRELTEVDVKALPRDLPDEIRVDVSGLESFEDYVYVRDLPVADNVEILREKEDIVVHVAPPTDVEEELEKPIEEDVEAVEVAGEAEEEEEEAGAPEGEESEGAGEEEPEEEEDTNKE